MEARPYKLDSRVIYILFTKWRRKAPIVGFVDFSLDLCYNIPI